MERDESNFDILVQARLTGQLVIEARRMGVTLETREGWLFHILDSLRTCPLWLSEKSPAEMAAELAHEIGLRQAARSE